MKFRIILLILIVTVSVKQAHRYHDSDEHNDKDDLMTTDHSTYRLELEGYDEECNNDYEQYVSKDIKSVFLADLEIQFKEILEKADVDRSLARHCNTANKIAVAELKTEIFTEIYDTSINTGEAGREMLDESFSLNSVILNIIKDIKTLVENCVADNKTKPSECVYKQIMAKITSLLDKMHHLGEAYLTSVEHTTACTSKVQDNLASKKNAIIADYKKCVNQLKNNIIL